MKAHGVVVDGHARPGQVRTGFALIEVAISSLLVGSILVAALSSVGAVLRFRSATTDSARATLLATDLLAEIQSLPYADPNQTPAFGKESGETQRSLFDDVDDYTGLTESPPADRSGASLTGYSGWQRAVTVFRAQRAAPMQTAATDEGLKRVRVIVSKNGTPLKTVDALVVNF
jgi:Tfp pilus assembly protein PilV